MIMRQLTTVNLDREIQYGYNYKDILLPFNRCETQMKILDSRKEPGYSFLSELYPPFDEEKRCKHNNTFSETLSLASG